MPREEIERIVDEEIAARALAFDGAIMNATRVGHHAHLGRRFLLSMAEHWTDLQVPASFAATQALNEVVRERMIECLAADRHPHG